MRSNCFTWAHAEYRRRRRAWRMLGSSPDFVPVILKRPSMLIPRWIDHWLVAWLDRETGLLSDIMSFKPDDHASLPWWRLWRALFFHGRVHQGDRP